MKLYKIHTKTGRVYYTRSINKVGTMVYLNGVYKLVRYKSSTQFCTYKLVQVAVSKMVSSKAIESYRLTQPSFSEIQYL